MLKLIILAFIFTSCAHLNKESEQPKEDLSSYVDIAQTSYLKGCIDGMNAIKKKKTYGVRFNICKDLSKKHKTDMETLLK